MKICAMKMHLLDANQKYGIACNNPRASGEGTADPELVTCERCQPDGVRVPVMPSGPAGGD